MLLLLDHMLSILTLIFHDLLFQMCMQSLHICIQYITCYCNHHISIVEHQILLEMYLKLV